MRTLITSMIAASLLTVAMPVEAHGTRHMVARGWHHAPPVYRNYWVGPAIVGGVIAGAALSHYANPSVVYVETVPVQRAAPICTEWREVRTEDGRIIQERTCTQQ